MSAIERVAVTGASGYIGRHFLRWRAREGSPAVAVVRRDVPLPDAAAVRVADILDLDALTRAFAGCEAVVHLACMPVAGCWEDPVEGFRVNALGTVHVLTAARRAGVRRVVYTSSAQVYGRPESLPVAEDVPCRPVTPYGAGKLSGEIWCRAAVQAEGIEAVVLRLFNVYGPAVDGSPRPTVEALFLRSVWEGRPPVVRGHPEHVRDFVHVTDVVRALERALAVPQADGEPINIGTGRGTSMVQLARMAGRAWGKSVEPQVEPPTEEPIRLEADIGRARRWLRWEPEVTLEDGLAALARAITRARGG
ncbi:MAG: NAD-dependent epimerase/dehydratase family protein [Chloroflexi bacterium]|nr:NAD-dependent epimerase/dehydratase family protein [Chloroflexota bacterium]